MNQIEAKNLLYTLDGKQNNPTVLDIEGIVNNTGKIISNAKFQKKQCENLEKYCESLAEKMEIVSHSPVQLHPIGQKQIAALRNFSQFFNHMTAIFNSAISTGKIISDADMNQIEAKNLFYTLDGKQNNPTAPNIEGFVCLVFGIDSRGIELRSTR